MSKRSSDLLPWELREEGYAREFSKWAHTSILFYWWLTHHKGFPKPVARMIIKISEPKSRFLAIDLFAQLGFIDMKTANQLTDVFNKQNRCK